MRYAATRSFGLGALRSDLGFSHPLTRTSWSQASSRRRTEPTRSRSTSSDCERSGRGGRRSRYANWLARSSWSCSIPLHASRTTASSLVRVLPPLTPHAAPNQRLAFLFSIEGDPVAFLRTQRKYWAPTARNLASLVHTRTAEAKSKRAVESEPIYSHKL